MSLLLALIQFDEVSNAFAGESAGEVAKTVAGILWRRALSVVGIGGGQEEL